MNIEKATKLLKSATAKLKNGAPLDAEVAAVLARQGLGDPGDIPEALRVENRRPLTAEQQTRLEENMRKATAEAYETKPWGCPKGMPLAEYEQWMAMEQARSRKVEGDEKSPRRAAGTPRASREGMITVASIADEFKLLPREARAILRGAKIAKPAAGWAFKPDDPMLKTVRDALKSGPAKGERKAASGKGKRVTNTARKAKEIRESGAVFTSKARVKRTKSAPPKPTPSKREQLHALLKKATKDTAPKKRAAKAKSRRHK